MYAFIIRALPVIQIELSEDQVFCTFAPLQLKNAVSELFQLLKIMQVRFAGVEELKEDFMSEVQQDNLQSTLIAENLEEIFFEDPRFNEMLL
jgi:hypothetical protein